MAASSLPPGRPSLALYADIEMPSGLDGSYFPGVGSTGPPRSRRPYNPEGHHTMPFTLPSDDELIAQLLIHTWTLTTGKTLRGDVPRHELTEEELIDFWSDGRFD